MGKLMIIQQVDHRDSILAREIVREDDIEGLEKKSSSGISRGLTRR